MKRTLFDMIYFLSCYCLLLDNLRLPKRNILTAVEERVAEVLFLPNIIGTSNLSVSPLTSQFRWHCNHETGKILYQHA